MNLSKVLCVSLAISTLPLGVIQETSAQEIALPVQNNSSAVHKATDTETSEYRPDDTIRKDILKIIEGEAFFKQQKIKRLQLKKSDNEKSWLSERIEALVKRLMEFFGSSNSDTPNTDLPSASALAAAIKYLIYGLFLGLIVFLFFRYAHLLKKFGLVFDITEKSDESKPDVLYGLQVTPESLPEDVAKAALALTSENKIREALHLVYRASLSHLINCEELPLHKAQTELECSSVVANHLSNSGKADYFQQLTKIWLELVYAHRSPDISDVKNLCTEWPFAIKHDEGNSRLQGDNAS